VLVNRIDFIRNLSVCNIVIKNEQQRGVYNLAGGAAGFDQNFTVYCGDSVLGTASVGKTLTADGRRYILERNEDVLTLNIKGFSDLQVIQFASGSSILPDEELQIKFTIKNNGDETASATLLYIYDNNVKIGETVVGAIAAGASASGSCSIAGGSLAQGSHRIRLVADGAGSEAESNEDNNGYTRSILVSELPDLVITSFSSIAVTADKDDLLLNFTVKNQGMGAAGTSQLYIYIDGRLYGSTAVNALVAGKSFSGSYTIAGNTLACGAHRIRLVADGAGTVAETDNNNNGYTRSVTVKPASEANLQVTLFSMPGEVDQHTSVDIKFTVRNIGSGMAEASSLYIYADGVKIGECAVDSIASGSSYSGTCSIAAGTLARGSHRIRLVADGGNEIMETNENDNGYTRTVVVSDLPDLSVYKFSAAGSISSSQDLVLNYSIKNSGRGMAEASGLYIYADGVRIGSCSVNSIASGSTCSGSYTIAAGTLAAGAHRIRLVADGSGVLAESNENNNGYTRSVNIVPAVDADLQITVFSAPAAVDPQQDMVLKYTLKNSGSAAAGPTALYIYCDGVKIDECVVDAVAAQGSVSGSYTVDSGTVGVGAHRIRLVADGTGVLAESNENNNGYTRTVRVEPLPDLLISFFNAPVSVVSNREILLDYTVKNIGSSESATCKLYIYCDGVKIGQVAIDEVAAGASQSGRYTLPAGILSLGSHRIRLLADGAAQVEERNNDNNGYTRTINVVDKYTSGAADKPENWSVYPDSPGCLIDDIPLGTVDISEEYFASAYPDIQLVAGNFAWGSEDQIQDDLLAAGPDKRLENEIFSSDLKSDMMLA